jgi:hypothetical protein
MAIILAAIFKMAIKMRKMKLDDFIETKAKKSPISPGLVSSGY